MASRVAAASRFRFGRALARFSGMSRLLAKSFPVPSKRRLTSEVNPPRMKSTAVYLAADGGPGAACRGAQPLRPPRRPGLDTDGRDRYLSLWLIVRDGR